MILLKSKSHFNTTNKQHIQHKSQNIFLLSVNKNIYKYLPL